VVTGGTDEQAAVLASAYAPCVHSIRSGAGAIAYPTPKEAAARDWTAEDRALVKDRLDTQLVGAPGTVADRLEQLRDATARTSWCSPRSPTTTPTGCAPLS
jgi:alkanesulfonate monooxygenase SsuD/methylene tetrahydromethanopterin reductase-like flavin-dependent oxidoreductase (luciferase family)